MLFKLMKLFHIVRNPFLFGALMKGCAAGVEHLSLLRSLSCNTVVDIGANKGQFALAARICFPDATIVSFEPLLAPAAKYKKVFTDDEKAVLYLIAIGPELGQMPMHVSGKKDSSSLLPITALQDQLFPGTAECGEQCVKVAPLMQFLSVGDIEPPAMLKLDVQGYELEALRGCNELLTYFTYVYVECSFLELYAGQSLAYDVIAFLGENGFQLDGVYNMAYDNAGLAIQADFFFSVSSHHE